MTAIGLYTSYTGGQVVKTVLCV